MCFIRNLILFIIAFSFGATLKAQKPIGQFNNDSIKIGEIVTYSLEFKHNSKQDLVFPDINFNYAPFELVDKTYFPTKSYKGTSLDSAVYHLRTFNIGEFQNLALPVFVLKNGDSTAIYSSKDSVYIKQQISGDVKGIKLKSESTFIPMKAKQNILFIFLQIATVLLVAFIWWLFFGKIIRRQFKLLSIYRRHLDFKNTFNRYVKNINKTNIEKTLILWKKYMGSLKKQPFNTMTTPEIIQNIPLENLSEALRIIDSSIYGNVIAENINDSIKILSQLADKQYIIKKIEIN
jgi:hypothetical protein